MEAGGIAPGFVVVVLEMEDVARVQLELQIVVKDLADRKART